MVRDLHGKFSYLRRAGVATRRITLDERGGIADHFREDELRDCFDE
jgi:hypothetical protein